MTLGWQNPTQSVNMTQHYTTQNYHVIFGLTILTHIINVLHLCSTHKTRLTRLTRLTKCHFTNIHLKTLGI